MPIIVMRILLNGLKDILSVAILGKVMQYLCQVSVHACKCLNYVCVLALGMQRTKISSVQLIIFNKTKQKETKQSKTETILTLNL